MDSKDRKINIPREFKLPEKHYFVNVPRNATIEPLGLGFFKHEVKYRWDWFKILISMLQLLFSIYSLYKVTQHQLDRFGYAAFGLTVAPYAIMGTLNLIANLITPEFDEVSLVYTKNLPEILQLTGHSIKDFALVGQLVERDNYEMEQSYEMQADSDTTAMLTTEYLKAPHPLKQRFLWLFKLHSDQQKYRAFSYSAWIRNWFLTILSMVVVAGVYGIVYVISKAKPGQSTLGERIWTMGWLFCGSASPFVMIFISYIHAFSSTLLNRFKAHTLSMLLSLITVLAFAILFSAVGAFTIGGIVAVAEMMSAFGTCTALN
jgi:hypothetical protein